MENLFGIVLLLVAFVASFVKLGNVVDGKVEKVVSDQKWTWILDVIATFFIYAGIALLIDGGLVIREIYIINGEPMTKNEGFGIREILGGLLIIPSMILLVVSLSSSRLQKLFSSVNAVALLLLDLELLTGIGGYIIYYLK